jgi:ketosteroid isomerase-like protein
VAGARLDLVRRGLEAMERGDIDLIVAGADDDVKFVNPDSALEPGTREGREGYRAGMQAMLDAFDDLRFQLDQMHETGDQVVVVGSFTGHGRTSGVEFAAQPFALVVTFRGERVVRYEWFSRAEEALAAAGLDPASVISEGGTAGGP